MTTTHSQAQSLTLLNLTSIFGEKNASKRLQAIAELWVPSSDVFFVDAQGVFRSHGAISDMIGKIQGMGGEGDEFVALGEVECLKHDDEEDVWVTKVKWGIRKGGDGGVGLTGEDVVTIVRGKIKACYTFLDSE